MRLLKFMKKMLCPYCDHEMIEKGRCNFCGSKVKKPIYVEVSDDLNARFSTENKDKNYTTEFVEQSEKNSDYTNLAQDRNSADAAGQKEQNPSSQIHQKVQTAAPRTQPRAKAMSASEAVAESVKKGTNVKGSSTVSKVVTVIVIVWIVFGILSFIVNVFLL